MIRANDGIETRPSYVWGTFSGYLALFAALGQTLSFVPWPGGTKVGGVPGLHLRKYTPVGMKYLVCTEMS